LEVQQLVNTSKQAEQQAEPISKILYSTDPTDPTDLNKSNFHTISYDEGNLQQRQDGETGADRSDRSVVRSMRR
jgi:hypothetical protein